MIMYYMIMYWNMFIKKNCYFLSLFGWLFWLRVGFILFNFDNLLRLLYGVRLGLVVGWRFGDFMVGFGLKFLCEELGVLEVVGDKEMGLKNRDFDGGIWGLGNWFLFKKMK